jgi:hypothetical protein
MNYNIDIKETNIFKLDSKLLEALLIDHSSKKNLIWATDNYASRGVGYQSYDHITSNAIIKRNGSVIKPRVEKSKKEQASRVKDKAEVFTPSWICNAQNNLIDYAWFGKGNVFNTETDKGWIVNLERITFPEGKSWQDYVKENRLEITCGEAPYLVSRYDTVTGNIIAIKERIGLLDRKLRVISENVDGEQEWVEWAKIAFKSVYGFDWQGDNVLLARENLLRTFIDYYTDKFGLSPITEYLIDFAEIISWNIWQMDGLKYVIPNSCKSVDETVYTLFGEEHHKIECEGCKTNNPNKHNGIYCYIMDWSTNKRVKFVRLIKKQ